MASQRLKGGKRGTKQIGESKGEEEESRQDSVILNDNHRIRDKPWLCRRGDENAARVKMT